MLLGVYKTFVYLFEQKKGQPCLLNSPRISRVMRIAVRVAPRTQRLSDAAVLRVTTLLFEESQPEAVVRHVQEGMRRFGRARAGEHVESSKRVRK